MRCKLLVVFLVMSLPILADEEVRDSVRVKEVEITATRRQHLNDGFQQMELSGELTGSYSYRTLGEVLTNNSNVNIRSYGSPGSSTSISFRGLSASQTQVNWNGFPINSVTLGSADISNILVSSSNTVSLVPGAAGATYGSGTFGGAVNIDYNSSNVGNRGVIDLTIGAFDTYRAGGNYQFNKNKLTLNGNLWGEKSDADYDYFDAIKQKEFKRHNADYNQAGFEQYFSYKPSAYSELKGGIWAQAKDMNIPAIEGASLKSYENQKDSTLRLFLNYKRVFHSSALEVKGAWFYADQHYIQKDSIDAPKVLIDSRIKSKAWFGDVNYRIYFADYLSFDAGATYNYTKGIVDAYGGEEHDRVIGLIGGLKYTNKVSVNMAFRKDFGNNVNSDLLFNAGVQYPLLNSLIVRGAFSQKFRRPTFNDMFWQPGGNPDLKPEEGYSFEAGANYILDMKQWGRLTTDVAVYYSPVKNMIVWRPEGALWYAKNYSDVLTRGIDVKINHEKQFASIVLQSNASLGYNKATIESIDENNQAKVGRSLYYAPEWMSHVSSGFITNNKIAFRLNWNFVSKRYYDDSVFALDPYWLMNARVAKTFSFGKQELFAQFSLENLFDHSYQSIRSYPMPGRTWQIKLKYILN